MDKDSSKSCWNTLDRGSQTRSASPDSVAAQVLTSTSSTRPHEPHLDGFRLELELADPVCSETWFSSRGFSVLPLTSLFHTPAGFMTSQLFRSQWFLLIVKIDVIQYNWMLLSRMMWMCMNYSPDWSLCEQGQSGSHVSVTVRVSCLMSPVSCLSCLSCLSRLRLCLAALM